MSTVRKQHEKSRATSSPDQARQRREESGLLAAVSTNDEQLASGEAKTAERKDYLQSLVEQHGSIDRAARAAELPRSQFREECRALGVKAHRRPLLPEWDIDKRSWDEKRAFDELASLTFDQIDDDIEEMFSAIKEASKQAFLRIFFFDKHDRAAAARFVLAYERMNWWQKDLLVLTAAIFSDGCTRKFAESNVQGSINSIRDAALVSLAAGTQEGVAG